MFDLAPALPPVDWAKAFTHLPEKDIIKAVGGPKESTPTRWTVTTGGAMIQRTPNDPAWYKGGLWQSDDHAHQRPRLLVHDLVRRLHRPQSRRL